ncbi:MAG: hypothetical protein B5M53_10475, partial [Candidatus Cloacimonas sp. 4484_209]
MKREAKKLNFQEAWESTIVFFNNEGVERKIDQEINRISKNSTNSRISTPGQLDIDEIADYLSEKVNGLDVILADIAFSREKFLRIISLLRRIGKIPGSFNSEWSIRKIKAKIREDRDFALLIANLFIDGHKDPDMVRYLPKYYREKLNLRGLGVDSAEKRRLKFKESKTGTYAALKGKAIENLIEKKLQRIQSQYGAPYGSGRSWIVNTDVDFAIPSTDEPYVLIMVTYQETTSSGQSTKARDMFDGYQRVHTYNVRNNESRAFVNFVDGGGWLARKNDFQRLVSECDYFLNLQHLDMLESIIKKHVPDRFFREA